MPPTLGIEVQDFGPIERGKLRLRPLTILTGPNNAGKSYLAMLVYALSGSFGRAPVRFRRGAFLIRRFAHADPRKPLSKEAKKWLVEQVKRGQVRTFDELPAEIRDHTDSVIGQVAKGLVEAVSEELERSFSAKLADLVRRDRAGFRLRIEQSDPNLEIGLAYAGENLGLKERRWVLGAIPVVSDELKGIPADFFWETFDGFAAQKVFEGLLSRAYYFPAARSGILQGHKALASFILTRAPLAGIQRFEIPTLSGVLADFLANLLSLEKGEAHPETRDVAGFLEQQACKGTVELGAPESRLDYPEIYYGFANTKLPLHRTSSMVSEIAPIILFLKYLVRKGDLLVIEEPEAHLHPDNQRVLAQAMAKLIRRGIRLLITTHSDYLLHQLSNFIMMGNAEEGRIKLGYSEDDYLLPGEVAAYLVSTGADGHGSNVTELEVTEDDGIPEEEFVRIQEALYDETTKIEYSKRG